MDMIDRCLLGANQVHVALQDDVTRARTERGIRTQSHQIDEGSQLIEQARATKEQAKQISSENPIALERMRTRDVVESVSRNRDASKRN